MDLVACTIRNIGALAPQEIREAILWMQQTLLNSPDKLEKDCFPVVHHFAPGVYAREMTIPEGVVLIGKLHRHAGLNILSKGRIAVLTEAGYAEYSAPCTFVSPAGTKRLGYTLEECVWTNIHPTNSTDLAEIEREVIANDYSDIEITGEYSEVL